MKIEVDTENGPAVQSPYGIVLLSDLFCLDRGAGLLVWRERGRELFKSENAFKRWNSIYAGSLALNSSTSQYKHGAIFNVPCYAHRVIYAMANGAWPAFDIDHISGVKSDNRPENLRDVSKSDNGKNKAIPANNKSGVIGVYWHNLRRKWAAQIDGPHQYLGIFDTIEDAREARKNAEIARGFHPTHGRDKPTKLQRGNRT